MKGWGSMGRGGWVIKSRVGWVGHEGVGGGVSCRGGMGGS